MKFLYILLLPLLIFSCSRKNSLDHSPEDKIERTAIKVPYELGSNYFVKNNVDLSNLNKSYLDSKIIFDSIFGIARTMSKESDPTPIDFTQQIVIPIILEETNIGSTITVDSVNKIGNHLKIRYTVTEVQPISYIVQPCELIIINRKEISDLNELELSFEKTTKVL